MMGQTNLLLAGLDVGLTAKATTGLLKSSARTAAAFSKIKPAQLAQVMKEVAAGNIEKARSVLRTVGQVSDEVADEIVRSLGGLRGERLAIEGVPGEVEGAIDPKQPMQSRGTARGSNQITAPNSNIAPEIVAKWSKTKNWKEVEPFIGQQAGDKLPPGYRYRKGKGGEGWEIVRDVNDNEKLVPLQIGEDGTLQITSTVSRRISNPRAMEKNFEAAYGKRHKGYWIHHIIPDDVVRSNAFAKLARSLGYDLDKADNLIGLADKNEWQKIIKGEGQEIGDGYTHAVGHWTSHENYSKQVSQYLDRRFNQLKQEFGDLEQALKDPQKKTQITNEVNQIMEDTENEFRSLIEKGKLPVKNGRIAWNSNQDNQHTA
jgi:hypothetical protein